MALPAFKVTLHHLAPDGTKAGSHFADHELPQTPEETLHRLLHALATVAASDCGLALPALRIESPTGRFVVGVQGGRLRFSSWATRAGGLELTADEIFANITEKGAAEEKPAAARNALTSPASHAPPPEKSSRLKIGLLAVLIVAVNAITVWLLLRPTPNPFLPEYELLPPGAATKVFAQAAGDYETGSREGDRTLTIAPDGHLHVAKYGRNRTPEEEADLTAQAARTNRGTALITSNQGMIEFKDPDTVVLFGDTYHRRIR